MYNSRFLDLSIREILEPLEYSRSFSKSWTFLGASRKWVLGFGYGPIWLNSGSPNPCVWHTPSPNPLTSTASSPWKHLMCSLNFDKSSSCSDEASHSGMPFRLTKFLFVPGLLNVSPCVLPAHSTSLSKDIIMVAGAHYETPLDLSSIYSFDGFKWFTWKTRWVFSQAGSWRL